MERDFRSLKCPRVNDAVNFIWSDERRTVGCCTPGQFTKTTGTNLYSFVYWRAGKQPHYLPMKMKKLRKEASIRPVAPRTFFSSVLVVAFWYRSRA
jgi:hypothetical protein